jgi:putative Ca2+/H+ antiporter (TMEM165/GDT1 family)
MQELLAIFLSVFIAELGDKTQLATVMFAADRKTAPVAVFLAAGLALLASTALAVGLGATMAGVLRDWPLKLIAGLGFVAIGAWNIYEHFR